MTEIKPQFLDQLTYAAKLDRQPVRDILTEGIVATGDLEVTELDTPGMGVKAASGAGYVQGDQTATQGHYRIYNDASKNLTIAASDPTNPRKDRIIAQVYDSIDIGGVDDEWVLEVLTGVAAGVPDAPALPEDALDLAIVDVGNGVTEILNADITDQRTQITFQNVEIEIPDGSITPIKLDAEASKKTIILTPGGAVFPASNFPVLVQINGTNHSYLVADFDKDTDEKCDWHFTIPANWDGGNITAYIKYIANATTGNVMWVIGHKGISETENIDQALTDVAFSADTVDGTANRLNIASKTFTLSGVTAGEWIILRLTRNADDGGDTLAVDTRLLEIVIEWTI